MCVQAVLNVAVSDVNGASGLQTPGMSAALSFHGGSGVVQLVYADAGEDGDSATGAVQALMEINPSSSLLPNASAAAAALALSGTPPLLAVLGSLGPQATEALSFTAGLMSLPVISPFVSMAPLGDYAAHPTLVRMHPSEDMLAWALFKMLIKSKWFRVIVITLDDDPSKSIANLLMSLLPTDGLESGMGPALNETQRSFDSRFEATLARISCLFQQYGLVHKSCHISGNWKCLGCR